MKGMIWIEVQIGQDYSFGSRFELIGKILELGLVENGLGNRMTRCD